MSKESGDSLPPGGVQVGARREPLGEFQNDHAVGEGPDGASARLVLDRSEQGRCGAILKAWW